MDADESITRLIGLVKDGREDAVAQLWHVYFDKLAGLARRKLEAAPRLASDDEDLALSAFKSFWKGVRDDRFPQLTDRTTLWPLLVAITLNKCVDRVRHECRKKRGGAAKEVLGIEEIVGREPDPQLAGEVADQLQHLLACLDRTGDPTLRRVAELRLHGHSAAEIATTMDCAKRTVERKLALIERCWATEAADEIEA